jgi:hypothetical protein
VAIATFAAARMAEEVRAGGLPAEDREARASAGRKWMSTLALSEPIRKSILDLMGATERDAAATAAALRRVIEVTGTALDALSRSDLERLARELDAQTVVGT